MLNKPSYTPAAAIFGCAGTALAANERQLFSDTRPVGFILFARNCSAPEQIRTLVQELRDCVGWRAPVLIDQEGGRVARLRPPHWRNAPAAGIFATLAVRNISQAITASYLNSRLIAEELVALGINVNCAPMLDIRFPFSHNIIGDRAFGDSAEQVIMLGEAMAKGLKDGGVIPVIKHLPGHGRAKLDSHEALPVVDASLEELRAADFVPFRALNKEPWGMTAHITYTAIDSKYPATLSKKVIDIIRGDIGFDGLLLTDDVSMKALKGSFAERTQRSFEAGCDVVLHCNGVMEEMVEVASNTPKLSKEGYRRLVSSLETVASPKVFDAPVAVAELSRLMG